MPKPLGASPPRSLAILMVCLVHRKRQRNPAAFCSTEDGSSRSSVANREWGACVRQAECAAQQMPEPAPKGAPGKAGGHGEKAEMSSEHPRSVLQACPNQRRLLCSIYSAAPVDAGDNVGGLGEVAAEEARLLLA